MENENKREIPKTTITYYGKKTYSINPMIARKKPVEKTVECKYEDIENDLKSSK